MDRVLASGRHLAVRRIGSWTLDDPVLVFLHEGLGSISIWRDFPDALAEATGLPALVYDRYGHGRSEPLVLPRPQNFLDIEAETTLPALLEATGIGRPILIGHSDGGTIALLFAAAFPDRPLACVTEAAHVVLEAVTRAGVNGVAERWRTDAAFRERLGRHHLAAAPMVRGWADVWLAPERRGWQMLDDLAAITCPVLVVQGDRDEHGTERQVRAITDGVGGPAESFIVPGCGHVPHHDARTAVVERMAAFIAAVLQRVAVT
jgi:pimeloyl-ACP methyl ester carboxylesterase